MYSNVSRNKTYTNRLIDFIWQEYKIKSINISPAKRGYYGETWRLNAIDRSYFIKLDYSPAHKVVYENSFPVMEHLCNYGVDFISKIVKTSQGKLCANFDKAILGVFEWIDGNHIENNDTKILEYQMLAKVYTVPVGNLAIPHEKFTNTSASTYFDKWAKIETDSKALDFFEQNHTLLEHSATRLKYFAELCAKNKSHFYITHGDAGGNFIMNDEKNYIIDWDEAMCTPPERDAWVMCCHDWARELFNKTLLQNNIDYVLRPERLAYYCYHMFFFYLNAIIDGCTPAEMTTEIKERLLNGWIEERLGYADKL